MAGTKWSLSQFTIAALAITSFAVACSPEETCECSAEEQSITYIVVEMPPQPQALPPAVADTPAVADKTTANTNTNINTTTTYGPVPAPGVDVGNPANCIPSSNVSLHYGPGSNTVSNSTSSADSGSIHMNLAMNTAAVVLENIGAIKTVDCNDDGVAVTFDDSNVFAAAFEAWSANQEFVMITNHLGNCDAEFERGFFKVESVISASNNTIVCSATKHDIPDIAQSLQMNFTSIPTSTHDKRLTWNPSTSLAFADALPNNTLLFDLPPYINITADQADFSVNLTFSGYLNFNFWGFKLEALYFDLDTSFEADLGLSAHAAAAYSDSFKYAPDMLEYALIDVPGIIALGPGVAFAVGLDLNVSAAVDVHAGVGVSLLDGNVHLDVLQGGKTTTSGWTPVYTNYAKISEKAEVRADAYTNVTVELAFKLFGGLIDLTSGLTATPRLNNEFKLDGEEIVNGTTISLPNSQGCDESGVSLKTDFQFNLTAFATQWWNADLYGVVVPLWDLCYAF